MLVDIKGRSVKPVENPGIAVFSLGFRIFFLGASFFSVSSILYWMCIFVFGYQVSVAPISTSQWHAHEMIYGFSMAVIAGFLLTAVQNWTGQQTLSGRPLMLLFSLWAIPRILFLAGTPFLLYAAVFDILFTLMLLVALVQPIAKSKQWKQSAVLSKVLTLGIGNLVFYLGVFGLLEQGVFWGTYGGLYVVIGLILTVGRRVVPFFIEHGVGYEVELFNSRWIDLPSLFFFLAFFISELFISNRELSAYFAFALFILHSVRLIGWHTPGIWRASLLWSLYLALWCIALGFLLFAASDSYGIPKFVAIHSFAYGGIGVITLSMMARVSLGHTGRDVREPSKTISFALAALLLGTVCRVALPLLDASRYLLWIGISQVIWAIAFSLFLFVYTPILCKPRIDGQSG